MLGHRSGIWTAFFLWSLALIAVMAGVTHESGLFRRPTAASATVAENQAPAATPAAPKPAAAAFRTIIKLAVQWTIVLMAIAAVGLLLHASLDLSERRKRFAEAVTHELRTPLTAIRMYSEMLETGLIQGEENRQQYLHTLRLEAERLQCLVDNVLTHSRLDGNATAQRSDPAALGDILDAIQGRMEERCAQAEMTYSAEFLDGADHAMVQVDALALERILLNLIDNACKYGSPAKDRCIRLAASRNAERVFLSVTDSGPGIRPAEASGLFRPFHRCESSAAGRETGLGLGLSICRRLAREMGGELQHDSTFVEGCRMSLSLPAARASNAD